MKLESRPLPERSWEYLFFLEFTGQPDDPAVSDALHELAQTTGVPGEYIRDGASLPRLNEGVGVRRFPAQPLGQQGADKISTLFVLPHEAGSLHEILTVFNLHGLNLVKLESRPLPERKTGWCSGCCG